MRNTTLLFLFLAFRYFATGQSDFGLKAGINLADQYKTATFTQPPSLYKLKTKPMLGYQAGAYYRAFINTRFTIAAEANFSLIGSRNFYATEDQILYPDGKVHYYNEKIGYIEIPLIVEYHINKIYFGLGPGVAFKLFSKVTKFQGNTYNGLNFRDFDASANLLAGYKISNQLLVNFRYSHGVVNIMKDRFNQVTRNRFSNVSLLYSLKLKGSHAFARQ